MKSKDKIFYGWVVVAAGALIMGMIIGIGWNCFAQFIKPVCQEMGYSRRAMSTNQTLFSFVQMFINFSWGFIVSKVPLKRIIRVSAILFPTAYFCYSFCTKLWMFYACSLVIGATMQMTTVLPFSIIITNWFSEKRGMALGMTSMGTGIGGMIFNPIAASLIKSIGWRPTFRILGVAIFLLATLPHFFIIKLDPKEKGLKPYGYKGESGETGEETEEEDDGLPFKELVKTTRFRVVALCSCMTTTAIGCMTQCMSPHLSDSGYSVEAAAFMVSFCMAALAIGKMSLGVIYDKLGVKRSTLISMCCGALGLTGMIFCANKFMLPLIVIGQCLGSSFGTVGVPLVAQRLFGRKNFSTNYGVLSACSSVGGSLSPMINGAVYDKTGSYNPAFSVWVCCLIAAIITFSIILPKGAKKGEK